MGEERMFSASCVALERAVHPTSTGIEIPFANPCAKLDSNEKESRNGNTRELAMILRIVYGNMPFDEYLYNGQEKIAP
jgi:hypothetical protein